MSKYLRKQLDAESLSEMQTQPPICDFCGQHAPEYVYASRRMSTGRAKMCWRWCACPECAALVEEGNFAPLILSIANKLRTNLGGVVPIRVVRECVDQALGEFREYAIPTGKD